MWCIYLTYTLDREYKFSVYTYKRIARCGQTERQQKSGRHTGSAFLSITITTVTHTYKYYYNQMSSPYTTGQSEIVSCRYSCFMLLLVVLFKRKHIHTYVPNIYVGTYIVVHILLTDVWFSFIPYILKLCIYEYHIISSQLLSSSSHHPRSRLLYMSSLTCKCL